MVSHQISRRTASGREKRPNVCAQCPKGPSKRSAPCRPAASAAPAQPRSLTQVSCNALIRFCWSARCIAAVCLHARRSQLARERARVTSAQARPRQDPASAPVGCWACAAALEHPHPWPALSLFAARRRGESEPGGTMPPEPRSSSIQDLTCPRR